ncbi:MAG: hypothetical protein LBI80_04450 [Endomicrobium sp.]|jgi:ADP-heptose:LPS heptosyltransferase|nr:hypothetical protein [Endomicrobium sp.]
MIYECPSDGDIKSLNINFDKIIKIATLRNETTEGIVDSRPFIKKLEHITKAVLRCFFSFLPFLFCIKNKDKFYAAFIMDGGIGDIIREISILVEIVKMFPNIVIDIYSARKTRILFKGLKNIRFFFELDMVIITKNKYDVIYSPMLQYQNTSNCQKIVFNNNTKSEIIKIKKNLNDYRNRFFASTKKELHHIVRQKTVAGVDNAEDIYLTLNFQVMPLDKFGINKSVKYITFNYGSGGNGCNIDSKCWDKKHWYSCLRILSENVKDIKIVQVGVSNYKVEGIDNIIQTASRTSFDELCTILKGSLLHIDIDGACTHICKAIGTKAVVLYGPTSAKIVGYTENINITSSVCRGCCHILDHKLWGKCLLEHEKSLCMDSIKPQFVAQKAIEYLKDLDG